MHHTSLPKWRASYSILPAPLRFLHKAHPGLVPGIFCPKEDHKWIQQRHTIILYSEYHPPKESRYWVLQRSANVAAAVGPTLYRILAKCLRVGPSYASAVSCAGFFQN